jgi:hypothetical protein
MRTETTTRNLYTFDELSETAKENAINQLSNINVDYKWWESEYEDAEQVGITITSFDLDRNRHACADIPNCQETAELILSNHGEECETYKTAKTFLDQYLPIKEKRDKCDDIYSRNKYRKCLSDTLDSLKSDLETLTEDFKQSITEDYSIMLQHQYEYLCSSEAIEETIKANEYEFAEDGELA